MNFPFDILTKIKLKWDFLVRVSIHMLRLRKKFVVLRICFIFFHFQLNVVEMFMLVALDEGPGPAIKYQYAELGRLYQVVSQLIRSCDVSHKQQSSQPVSMKFILYPFSAKIN